MPTISNLPSLTTVSNTVVFPVVDVDDNPDTTKKATFLQFRNYLESTVAVRTVAGKQGDVSLNNFDISGFATISTSGRYTDLINVPTTFPVTTATASVLGGVKIGSGINISNGVISVSAVVATATTSTLGAVVVGSNINVTGGGTISVATASNSTLGLVRIGSGIAVTNSGTISTTPLVTASNTILGGIKIGSGLSIDGDGVVTANTLTSNLLSNYLVINANETNNYVTNPDGAGIAIGRGNLNTSTQAAFMAYTDYYTYNDGTTQTSGTFFLAIGTVAAPVVTNGLRVLTDSDELNIFGANNPTSVISVKGTTNYEDQVIDDDHIPNKKYVDDVAAGGGVIASTTTLGVVRIGSGISISDTGTITVSAIPVITTATNSVAGVVRIGSGIQVTSSGTISLSTATESVPGAVKVGNNLSIQADGTLSVASSATFSSLSLQASPVIIYGITDDPDFLVFLPHTELATVSAIQGYVSNTISAGGTISGITQFTNTTSSTSTTTGAVVITGGLGVRQSVNVANTVTAQSFVSTTAGTPEVYSASNLNLAAVGRVQVTQSPFKVWNVSSSTRNTISASNGDMIYNTDTNKFQGYANGTWVDLN